MIADDDSGLSRRLMIERRRIANQHAKLGELWATFIDPLERLDWVLARSNFSHVRDGLIAHFEVEERVQIPALHRGQASRSEGLERLIADHHVFRAALADLARLLDTEELAPVSQSTAELMAQLGEHEEREEELFGLD